MDTRRQRRPGSQCQLTTAPSKVSHRQYQGGQLQSLGGWSLTISSAPLSLHGQLTGSILHAQICVSNSIMLKLSLYTCVKDGLYYDYHVVDMLKHHLPLADEIIVNEGFSKDGSYEAIKDIDPKIKSSSLRMGPFGCQQVAFSLQESSKGIMHERLVY